MNKSSIKRIKYFTLILFAFSVGLNLIVWRLAKLQLNFNSPQRVLGIENYLAQSTCTEPMGGCPSSYYWNSGFCSCMPQATSTPSSCQEPSGGCAPDHNWDPGSCSCVFIEGCSEPTGGCGDDFYWHSGICSCAYDGTMCTSAPNECESGQYWSSESCGCVSDGSCQPPSEGCGSDKYWEWSSCTCKDDSQGCDPPEWGCGDGWYWDSNACGCQEEVSSSGSSGGETCQEPSGGCGDDYYWDSYSCSCYYSGTGGCSEPSGGCSGDSWWDSYSCSCKSASYCSPPSTGCEVDSYWDSYSCTCKTSCYPPSAGCGSDSYWDYGSCVCRSNSSCEYPIQGCDENYYWDSYYCSCKPYQNVNSTTTCNPPPAGCGTDSYWDYYSCNCKIYPSGYTCSEPSGGCGGGWNWDEGICSCRSEEDDNVYYSTTDYSPYEHEQNFDRLAYEAPERINCVKTILTPTEFERLRYLVPSNDGENNEIRRLGERVTSCWGDSLSSSTTAMSGSVATSPIENEQCLLKALGKDTYREIYKGERQPIYGDYIKFEKCYGDNTADSVNYVTNNQSIPVVVVDCLQSVLGSDLYSNIKSGQVDVPYELRDKVDRCYGIDPQPFEEGKTYKIPESVKACLVQTVGEERYNQINSGTSEPTDTEKQKGEVCFGELNKTQVNFLPAPPEQVPYLQPDPGVINFESYFQDTKGAKSKYKGGKVIFSGKGPANSAVNIYIFSDPIVVTTKTDDNGDWVYELSQPLKGEKHIAYATVKDNSGKVVRSSVFNFTVIAAEDDLVQPLLDESRATDTTSRFIRLTTILVGVAVLLVVLLGAYFYRKNMKLMVAETKLHEKEDTSGKGDSEGHGSSGPVN